MIQPPTVPKTLLLTRVREKPRELRSDGKFLKIIKRLIESETAYYLLARPISGVGVASRTVPSLNNPAMSIALCKLRALKLLFSIV